MEELTDRHRSAVVELCRHALDLPADAAEAAQIIDRLHPAPPALAADDAAGLSRRRTVALVALVDQTVRGVVLGSLAHRDPAVGHVDLIAVHPDLRRHGLGRALLSRAESALAARGATEVLLAGNPPYYAWPGVDVRYTPAVCLAMACGYQQDRTAWNMTADLSATDSPALRDTDAAQQRLAAAGITVRRATAADVPALVAFTRTTFGDAWAAEVAQSVGRAGAGCHLAVRDPATATATATAATATASAATATATASAVGDGPVEVLGFAAYGSSRPSWFGPMGTAPTAQGLGIGALLLRRCLQEQRAAGHLQVEIGWVGPVPFYASAAGARIERVFFLYRKQL
ncbi:GNAT family N-acetyltransferase [Solwaraspora sp. WMMD791]|uniref:GNAT family N-acetyltransferase n=1 Tax=Solwaraspora sp. WMMD791 TaxID=3016086 RepID=UPI00249AB414|nr:GNAT family N-acetyltransferase [Solwaraspora sp. WMMD791]WFE30704.1 GNAT family N-acetyltransferase [Solwaraspora sp. WMMD791]